MLITPKLKTPDKIAPQTPQPVAPFPLRDQTLNTETSLVEIPLAKPPGQQAPKLPTQQALMPQNNPFDINSESPSKNKKWKQYLKPQNWMIFFYPLF